MSPLREGAHAARSSAAQRPTQGEGTRPGAGPLGGHTYRSITCEDRMTVPAERSGPSRNSQSPRGGRVPAADASPSRPIRFARMTWWESWFGEEYLELYPHRDLASARREVAFALAHFDPDPSPLLDLCCGSGRHSLRLAERGLVPVGLDYSAPLLELARARLHDLRLVRGDMRFLPFGDGSFRSIINFFTSFGYFVEETDNETVVAEIERVLGCRREGPLRHVRPGPRRRPPRVRREPVHAPARIPDPALVEPDDAPHREGDLGAPRQHHGDLPREREGLHARRAHGTLRACGAPGRATLGRLRRAARSVPTARA